LPAPLEGLDEPILADTAPLVTIESPVDREIAKLLRLDEIKQVQADRKALAVEHDMVLNHGYDAFPIFRKVSPA